MPHSHLLEGGILGLFAPQDLLTHAGMFHAFSMA